ncbi:LysR substrate-binding domain-containing protein [Pseudomonas asplenii]|uniref:LysR substrate-binding domain-containing protein n=1 Tax=Pseudomonas asplenii TaxID=53407 RepID=UPI000369A5E4|nr:LysR substrate-binding domain-containing protein [Pseudomonas fuscovaginae]
MPLLHKHESPHGWGRYAQLAGLVLPGHSAGPTYDRYALLIEAAKAGIGMALVPRRYIEQELNEGRLSAPWPAFAELSERYVLVTRPTPERPQALEKFESWLVEESASLVRTPACSR